LLSHLAREDHAHGPWHGIERVAQIVPFTEARHGRLTPIHAPQIAYFAVILALLLVMLSTPSYWKPAFKGVRAGASARGERLTGVQAKPNTYQTASPLSRMLFACIEGPMWRFPTGPDFGGLSSWLPGRPKQQLDFVSTVPNLPDILHARFVLRHFRWRGDVAGDGVKQGRSLAFARQYKAQVAKIVLVALVWVFATFLSPLSMNLVRMTSSSGYQT
jgi:hypothetical protein